MPSSAPYAAPTPATPPGHLLRGQVQHLMLLALLVPGALFLAEPALGDGSFFGLDDRLWVTLCLAAAAAHQLLVAVVFRLQLVYGLFTRLLGRAALPLWIATFMPFLLVRPLLVGAVGLSDMGSAPGLDPLSRLFLGAALLAPALYTFGSVIRYFGIRRAAGGDHFDPALRELPLVTEGAFQYSSNAMYAFGFLALWSVAALCGSWAALVMALFQHAYIWVHHYCTEQPDMEVLYKEA